MKHVTQAPVEVTINGTTYQCSPLRVRDIEEIDSWLRAKYIKAAIEAARDLDTKTASLVRKEAISLCGSISMLSPDGMDSLMNPQGMARIIYHSIKQNHPEVTVEQVNEFTTDEITYFFEQFKLLNGMTEREDSEGEESSSDPTKSTSPTS